MLKKLLMLCVALALSLSATFASAVEVNSADQATLETVKGIGPVHAKAIIDERTKNGPFKDADDLAARVKGIGTKSVTNLEAAGLTINGASTPPTGAKAATKSGTTATSTPATKTQVATRRIRRRPPRRRPRHPHRRPLPRVRLRPHRAARRRSRRRRARRRHPKQPLPPPPRRSSGKRPGAKPRAAKPRNRKRRRRARRHRLPLLRAPEIVGRTGYAVSAPEYVRESERSWT